MAIEMKLGGVAIGQEFPLYSQTFEFIRPDDQGGSVKKVNISLAGFLEGADHATLMTLYETLKAEIHNDTTFTYKDGSTIIHDGRPVWISGYTEPEDEYGKCRTGDYSISLYYFEDAEDNAPFNVSYGGFNFPKPPKFGRRIELKRRDKNAPPHGSTGTIGLSGIIYAANHTALVNTMEDFEASMSLDSNLQYGSLVQLCRASSCVVEENVLRNYFTYQVQLTYETGNLFELKRRMSISRIHDHPVITEEPLCDRRLIELMNKSGQFISYRFFVKGETVPLARSLLSTEITLEIEPGGIEMPGGTEDWDLDNCSAEVNFTKFYSDPVIPNLGGT